MATPIKQSKKREPARYERFASTEPDVTFIPPTKDWLTVFLLCEDDDRFEKALGKIRPFVKAGTVKLAKAAKSAKLKQMVASLLVADKATQKKIDEAVKGLGDIRAQG